MKHPKELLNQWEGLPHKKPSDQWRQKLLQRAAQSAQKTTVSPINKVLLILFIIGFTLLNVFYISKLLQGNTPKMKEREETLRHMSRQLFASI